MATLATLASQSGRNTNGSHRATIATITIQNATLSTKASVPIIDGQYRATLIVARQVSR
jgi:hypothetical protein